MLREVPAQETEIQKTGDQGEEERKKTEINKQEKERAEKEIQERLQKEEKDPLKKAKEEQKEHRRVAIKAAIQENIHTVKRKVGKEMIIAVVLIFSILLVGYWVFSIPPIIPKYSTNSIDMEFVLIQAGEFEMGSPSSEVGRIKYEGPVHHVTIPEPFYMSKYEVTQKQWHEVMGDNPSLWTGYDSPVDSPVEMVSWVDVQWFVKKLNEIENTDKYRLPTEAEWEYAARAGTTTRYSFGDDDSKLGEYAWYDKNSHAKTHPVGEKKANPWGLYDMHGNVWEWVQDEWNDTYDGAPADGSAWEYGFGAYRVFRGGGYKNNASYCRSAIRDNTTHRFSGAPYLGFRLLQEM